MSYVLAGSLRADVAPAPPPEPTAQALAIFAACALPLLPVALGVGAGFYVRSQSKQPSAIAPVLGTLFGVAGSVLLIRSKVIEGTAP